MHRVLRPDGKLLFCEHGRSPEPGVTHWQDKLTPYWKKVVGGCHLNRPIRRLNRGVEILVEEIENLYVEKLPQFAGYMYFGVASKVTEAA